MEDTLYYTNKGKLATEQNQANPSKSHYHFLYKVLAFVVFLVILPLFPSQAPEFINQSLLTRSWELLQLIFVGIAVSYGLFSRRNEEAEKEKENSSSKFENAQSYVSRFLQVSAFFDDEVESPSGSDETKLQTWSNLYYRNEPVVVVAPEKSGLDGQRANVSSVVEKPLFLPVRRLKARVPDPDSIDSASDSSEATRSVTKSNSKLGSKRFSSHSGGSRSLESRGQDFEDFGENLNENVARRSPIPWRSRSGRMELKEELEGPALFALSPSLEEAEFNRLESRSSKPRTPQSSRSNSMSKLSPSPSVSSPKKLSPLTSLSAELQAKSSEDLVRKKTVHKSSPPPPPPPPPPMISKSSSMKSRSDVNGDGVPFERELRRSVTSERKDMHQRSRENMLRGADAGIELEPGSQSTGFPAAKSVRTLRANEAVVSGARRGKEVGEEEVYRSVERVSKVAEATAIERTIRNTSVYDQTSLNSGPSGRYSNPTFMEFPEEKPEEFVDEVVMVSDEDTQSEDDENTAGSYVVPRENGGSPKDKDVRGGSNDKEAGSGSTTDPGTDVDKKADEFIAKFREQIRLQRIDSIKRSAAQMNKNSSR